MDRRGRAPERRQAPRSEARHAARLRFVTPLSGVVVGDEAGPWPTLICQTRDVSESGVALLVPALREGDENFFGVDGPVRVTLGLPTGALELEGVAIRYERGPGAGQREFVLCVRIFEDEGGAENWRAHIRMLLETEPHAELRCEWDANGRPRPKEIAERAGGHTQVAQARDGSGSGAISIQADVYGVAKLAGRDGQSRNVRDEVVAGVRPVQKVEELYERPQSRVLSEAEFAAHAQVYL